MPDIQEDLIAPGAQRTRVSLIIAIALLVALLGGLLYLFYNLLQPAGGPDASAEKASDMVWVRSMYGFGPHQDEQLQAPASVAIAPNGDVYATDPVRSRVMIFRPDGTFKRLLHTGSGGTGEGQFVRPESLDIDQDGNVYIADSFSRKVIVFDRDGQYLREWPVDLQARGIVASEGKVYVLDVGHVIVFDTEGNRLGAFGQRGPKPGQIDAYQGIAARDGFIYLADSFNKRLESFDESGSLKWVVPGGTASRSGPASRTATGKDESASDKVPEHRWDLPQDLVFDGNGRLIVVDAFQFELAVVDPKTGKVEAKYGEFGRNDGEFYYPTSIAYDPRRDWFAVADTQNNRIQIVRIPDSGNPASAAVWRAVSSPYRYLIIPAALLAFGVIAAIALAGWLSRRKRMSTFVANTPSEEA